MGHDYLPTTEDSLNEIREAIGSLERAITAATQALIIAQLHSAGELLALSDNPDLAAFMARPS